MHKTTVYLPDHLRAAVSAAARRRGVSEATVIRDAIAGAVTPARVAPRAGLFAGAPIARDVDEHLAGFGDR